MKKNPAKLVLHRETLTGLLSTVQGGNNSNPPICSVAIKCGPP
jgi:hypothetical protein